MYRSYLHHGRGRGHVLGPRSRGHAEAAHHLTRPRIEVHKRLPGQHRGVAQHVNAMQQIGGRQALIRELWAPAAEQAVARLAVGCVAVAPADALGHLHAAQISNDVPGQRARQLALQRPPHRLVLSAAIPAG